MTRRIWLASFILLLTVSVQAQNKSLNKLIHNVVRMGVDYEETPGLVIGVIDRDSSYVFSFGETERGNSQKPDGNTLYEIGSVTKVFTAALLPLLEKEGVLNTEDAVSEYFEDLSHLEYKEKDLSLRDLATHSSGLPRLPHNLGSKEKEAEQPYAHYTQQDLMQFLGKYQLTKPIGQKYAYSHTGYALLGETLGKATGEQYSSLLENYLFKPLAMNDTRIHLSDSQQERLAQGYSLVKAVPNWKFQSFESAFGLKSSVNDLLKWLSMHLGDTNEDLENILKANCVEQLDTETVDVYMATGWHILRLNKRFPDVLVHSGVTNGHTAYISFVKETHTAVVVLGNSKKSLSELGLTILETINYNWKLRKAKS